MNKITKNERIEKCIIYILAFILPAGIYGIFLIISNIEPFGNNILGGTDFNNQYIAFFTELSRKIKEGESLFYSWNMGFGTNFWALLGYYLSSPLNIILYFVPSGKVVATISILLAVKIGISGLACFTYLNYKYNKNSAIIFSTAYALSVYMVVMGYNIMWMDAVALFPLVILGLEKLVREDKKFVYVISLEVTIISNYYIGYMVCLFCVIYFVYLLICENKDRINKISIKIKQFTIYSILAGGCGMVIILPQLYALSNSYTTNVEGMRDGIVFYEFKRMLIGMLFDGMVGPPFYCTVGIFFLAIMFGLNKKIRLRERVGKTILCLILFLSAWLIPLDYVWNGFHSTHNVLGARYSFVFIFLIITMGYESFVKIKECSITGVIVAFGCITLMILALNDYYNGALMNTKRLMINIVLLLLYGAIFYIVVIKKKYSWVMLALIFIFIESAYFQINYTNVNFDSESIPSKIVVGEKYNNYRLVRNNAGIYYNDGMWSNYKTVNGYSSIMYQGVWNLMDRLYGKNNKNVLEYQYDEFFNMIFSVKGVIEENKIIEQKNSLSIGYFVGNSPENLFKGYGDKIWENFAYYSVGAKSAYDLKDIYTKLSKNSMTNVEIESDLLKGKCNIDEKGYLLITLPYDEGWSVKVDGKKMEIKNIDNIFTYISLEKGEHYIELKYVPKGFVLGAIISCFSVIILIVLYLFGRKNICRCMAYHHA